MLAAARSERGDTLIEILVSAMLMLVIAAGIVTGLTAFGHESASQRQHAQADALAQQYEGYLRGEGLSQLVSLVQAGSTGSTVSPAPTVNGTTYTITNTAAYVSGATSAQACSGSGTSNADYVKTTTTVTWPHMTGNPVVEEGLVTASAGGALVVQVLDENAHGDSGITVQVAGTDPNTSSTSESLNTDNNGCAVFYGLTAGTYTVSESSPGYIDTTDNASPSQAETVIAGETTNDSLVMAKGATLNTQFEDVAANGVQTPVSSYGGNATTNWVLQNTSITPPTAGESSSSVTPLFPFTTAYVAYPGTCASNNINSSSILLLPGATQSTPLLLPFMYVTTVTKGAGSGATSTLSSVQFSDVGCGTSYPALAINATNTGGGQATAPQSEALPSGTYNVCAQWVVASSTTTVPTTTSTSTSYSYSTTTTHVFGVGWVTSTSTSTSRSSRTTSYTTTSTSTSTVAESTTSVTNTTSATSTPTLSQNAASSGSC